MTRERRRRRRRRRGGLPLVIVAVAAALATGEAASIARIRGHHDHLDHAATASIDWPAAPPKEEAGSKEEAPQIKGWKPWEIGSLRKENPALAAKADMAALRWEEKQMEQRVERGRAARAAPQRMMESRTGKVAGAPEWFHYMPPWWERPDTPDIPKSDFKDTPELKSIAEAPDGVMPYFQPWDHIL